MKCDERNFSMSVAPIVTPTATGQVPAWQHDDAHAMMTQLERVRVECVQARTQLRRRAVPARQDWTGPSRVDFERGTARLVADLTDLEQTALVLHHRIELRDAQVQQECLAAFPLMGTNMMVPRCNGPLRPPK